MAEEILYTIKEAAALLRLYYKSVYRMIADGRIEAISIGNRRMITGTTMERLMRHGVPNKEQK